MNRDLIDTVYYWQGGTEHGRWLEAFGHRGKAREHLRSVIQDIERQGRVAFLGSTSIGAPVGPPKRAHFVRIGMAKPEPRP